MRVWMLVLVVVGIFGLGALLFPMYARVEEHIPARCISNIDEIVKATIMYAQETPEPSQPRRERQAGSTRAHRGQAIPRDSRPNR